MKVAFAGTPEFARAALQAIQASGHQVVLVLTQPDRPAGRGMKLQPSPVKAWAEAAGLPVAQPTSLRLDGRYPEEAAQARTLLSEAAPDVMVVVAYGLLLPAWTLALPRLGCINIHASLLPRWRGAAPIHRAIEAGDTQTGITLMQMDEGLDTGAMLCHQALDIRPEDTTATLHDRLAALGAQLCVQALAQPEPWQAQPQANSGVSYAHKIAKEEAPIDWTLPAEVIERRIRAFDPFPGALWLREDGPVKVWKAEVVPVQGRPGQRCPSAPDAWVMACGQGALKLLELQRAGGRRVTAQAFLQAERSGTA
jgi:methionyl-tRNA formyltransferase